MYTVQSGAWLQPVYFSDMSYMEALKVKREILYNLTTNNFSF